MEKSEPIEQVIEGIGEPAPTFKKSRPILWVVGGLVLAGGLGVLAYYVIFPLVFPGRPAVTSSIPSSTQRLQLRHVSYFTQPTGARSKITFQELNSGTIRDALGQIAASVAPAGTLKELEIASPSGQVLSAEFLDGAMSLTVSKTFLGKWFEQDFTGFLYYNNGAWPGYVLKIKSGANRNEIVSDFYPDIESSANNLYISFASLGEWKLGNYNGSASRYAIGRRPGESFNYGVFGNYLVLSTNFDGFKAAISALGF